MKFKEKVQSQPIEEGLVGTLFFPKAQEKFPGVILLPGSDGGVPNTIAEHMASHGVTVLALGYFRTKGLPSSLENIPLEYFQRAIESFRRIPQVKENSVTLMGYSRGGELVLLLGASFPGLMDGIVAYVPSCVVSGGFPHPNRPAWSLDNNPVIPFLKGLMSSDQSLTEAEDLARACERGEISYHNNSQEDPYDVVDLFLARHKRYDWEEITIPVEKILCPLLVISGEQDRIWPSALYARRIMERLTQKGSKIERKSLIYPHAGHGIIAPYEGSVYHPVGKFWCALGGTPEGNRGAHENALEEVLRFIEKI